MRFRCWLFVSLMLNSGFVFSKSNLEKELSLIANQFISESGYVGLSVAAQQGGKELFNLSFGHTDIERTHPFTMNTVVALGSNMKVVTANFIHQLSEQQKIDINAPFGRYLRNNIKYGNKVKIKDLLCHTSGLPNVFGEGEFLDYHWEKALSKKELLDRINSSVINPVPNNKYEYNNTGYLILGWIIEDVTGMTLGDYTREHLIKPHNLQKTYYLGDTFHIPNFSDGFQSKNGNLQAIPQEELIEYRVVGGAGALGGTLSDYNKWFSLVAKGKLVSAKTKQLMQTPCKLNSGENAPEALGIEWSEVEGEKALNGGGVVNGFLSLSYYFPEYDLTIGFVGNTETDWIAFYEKYFATVLRWYKNQH
ncbi:beta-lactamase family protein [Thalassotalea sp. M1531]|uniref:Beta-lactamase family protein n=1 Tax=Thalassotalea algicola TaxID=2716224 RepID=A0A7Y0LE78_9GAMM|nr:serine hydrolase domain-containing protein [Thalassotalea algicola]NMP31525.1 beta-lactamase family protein [Thalassotalea algicola]